MRFFFKLILLLLLGLPFAVGAALFLAIDTQPTIERAAEVTPASVERAKRIINQNDPRKLKSGARRTVTIDAGDLDLAANYLAHRYGRGSARVSLGNGGAQVGVSVTIPRLPVKIYFNIDAALVERQPLPAIDRLRIGKLPVPGWLAHWLIANAPKWIRPDLELASFDNIVQQVAIKDRAIAVAYEWREETLKTLRAAVLPGDEQQRLAIYHERLVSIAQKHPGKRVSLVEFLTPLFQLAKERSAQSDAASENRAAIFVLALYANGKSFEQILPETKARPKPVRHELVLNQRDDFAKHFIISAALAASAGSPLADAVGLYKEIADSRGGSGFSFNDIAADRAGVRFGESAASGPSAKQLQARVAAGFKESDLMPATADLPEFLAEAEFKRRFGGVDGVGYRKMMAEIERRIAALPLYR